MWLTVSGTFTQQKGRWLAAHLVHFLFLAGALCFEFSRSPCGLTPRWWESDSGATNHFIPPNRRCTPVFLFLSFLSWREFQEKNERRAKMISGPFKCVERWLICQIFLPLPEQLLSRIQESSAIWPKSSQENKIFRWWGGKEDCVFSKLLLILSAV